jgi:hypothetical protein
MVGGDSTSTIRLASAARGAGIQLVATDVIEHPTIRAMARMSQSATVNHDFDDDDVPSVTLDQMIPNDLTLMNLDRKGLDALRNALWSKHHLSPRYAQVHLILAGTHQFIAVASLTCSHAQQYKAVTSLLAFQLVPPTLLDRPTISQPEPTPSSVRRVHESPQRS